MLLVSRSALALLIVCAFAAPAYAVPTFLIPPVDGVVIRGFEAPGTQWGPGHRGMDLAALPGTEVRAAAAGTVTFAGSVAGLLAVTIDHGQGLETTYSRLSSIEVTEGEPVGEGRRIGRTSAAHPDGDGGLHFGVKLNGDYVDPAAFIGPLDLSSAIHLAPLVTQADDLLPSAFDLPLSAEATEACITPRLYDPNPRPPSDNVAVLVAGIGSRTQGRTSAALYESGGAALGYPESRTYRFSYRGDRSPSLHQPYSSVDTFGDIRSAADRLRALIRKIGNRHPGAAIDLVAHSQGGVVARTFLQLKAGSWDASLPPIEHLVTFAAPHTGAPLAGARDDVAATRWGKLALQVGSWAAYRGSPIPDPLSTAVGQLAPGSPLMDRLADETVLFGTRVLTLAIPNDLVVPADRARWAPHAHSVVEPRGLNGHDAIVTSSPALAAARTFLRGGPPLCRGAWDLWGPRVGRTVSFLERNVPRLLRIGSWLVP